MTARNKKATAIVFLGFTVLQIIITVVKYLQLAYNLDNPLIPNNLIAGVKNYSIAIIIGYLLAALVNVLYIIMEKYFWATMVFSFITFAAILFFAPIIYR
jgi:hypothetical protein